jgi:hypothetical protein
MVKDVICQSIRLTKNISRVRDLSVLPYIGNDQVTVAEFRFIGVFMLQTSTLGSNRVRWVPKEKVCELRTRVRDPNE